MNKFNEVLKIRREEVRQQRSRALEMQRKRLKKQQRIENIITCTTLIFVVIITILLVISYIKLNDKDMKNCINAGHSKQYCEKGF